MWIAAQAVRVHADHVEQHRRPCPALVARHLRTVRAEHVLELGPDRDDRVQRAQRALQHHGDLRPPEAAQLLRAGGQDVDRALRPVAAEGFRVEQHLAAGDHGRWAKQPDRRHRQGGLSAAALSGEAEHAAPAQDQIAVPDRMDRLVAVPVIDGKAADLQHRIGGALHRGSGQLCPAHHGCQAQRRADVNTRFPRRSRGETRRPQLRVDELVDPEVHEGKPGAEKRHAYARGRPPPPPAAAHCIVGETLTQHLAPVPQSGRRAGGRSREAEEGDGDVGVDRRQGREQKRGGNDGNEVGKDLGHDDADATFARDPGRFDEVSIAEG